MLMMRATAGILSWDCQWLDGTLRRGDDEPNPQTWGGGGPIVHPNLVVACAAITM